MYESPSKVQESIPNESKPTASGEEVHSQSDFIKAFSSL